MFAGVLALQAKQAEAKNGLVSKMAGMSLGKAETTKTVTRKNAKQTVEEMAAEMAAMQVLLEEKKQRSIQMARDDDAKQQQEESDGEREEEEEYEDDDDDILDLIAKGGGTVAAPSKERERPGKQLGDDGSSSLDEKEEEMKKAKEESKRVYEEAQKNSQSSKKKKKKKKVQDEEENSQSSKKTPSKKKKKKKVQDEEENSQPPPGAKKEKKEKVQASDSSSSSGTTITVRVRRFEGVNYAAQRDAVQTLLPKPAILGKMKAVEDTKVQRYLDQLRQDTQALVARPSTGNPLKVEEGLPAREAPPVPAQASVQAPTPSREAFEAMTFKTRMDKILVHGLDDPKNDDLTLQSARRVMGDTLIQDYLEANPLLRDEIEDKWATVRGKLEPLY